MTIYFYGRCSDEEHFNKGTSIATQLDKCKSYASLKDLHIDEEITESCSGTIKFSKRPKGFELLQKLKRNDAIICQEISRFSRNTLDLLKLVEKFKIKKVSLHFTDIGEITGTDAVGSVVYKLLITFQEFYARQCSEKQKATQQRLIKEGRFTGGSRAPFGYDVDDNNYLIPCEKDQQIIRKMQLMRRQGTSYQKISTDITKQTRKKFPVSWVWKILKREGSEHKILNRPHNQQILEVA